MASQASDETSVDRTKGKRRIRVVHKNHDALGACDSYTIRRIKCIRSDPEDPTCEACRSRHINCTNFRNGGARYKPRSGKKINAVIAAFGASASAPGKSLNPNVSWHKAHRTSTEDESSNDADAQHRHFLRAAGVTVGDRASPGSLSDDSADGRLSLTVESESVLASLMDLYLSTSTFSYPLVAWKNLQARFDKAGRRLSQLDVMTETLVLACIGFGALISDHPLIIGGQGPRVQQLRTLGSAYSLAPWAMRREAFCRQIVEKVVAQVDQRGVFRIACPEAISILGMTAELLVHSTGRQSFALVRPYWFAQYSHSRHLADTNDPGNELSTLTHWHLAMEDSFRSMINGTSPIMSDEDIADFCEMPGMPEVSLEVLPAAVNSTSLRVFGLVIASFWHSLITLNRSFSRKVSIPFARNRAVEASTFAEFLHRGSALWKLATDAQRDARMLVISAPTEVTAEQRRQFGSSLSDHIDAFPLSVAMFFLSFCHKWNQWKQRREAFCEIGVANQAEGTEAAKIQEIRDLLTEHLVDGVLLVARMIEERRETRATELFSHLNPFATVRFHLFKWAMFALKIKCAEAGGPAKFPAAVQLTVLQTFVDALRTQAWVWASMQDSADQVEAGLRKLAATMPQQVAAAAGMVAPLAPAPQALSATAAKDEPSPPLSHFESRPVRLSPPTSFNTGFDTLLPPAPKASRSPPSPSPSTSPRLEPTFPLSPLSPQTIAAGRPSSRRGSATSLASPSQQMHEAGTADLLRPMPVRQRPSAPMSSASIDQRYLEAPAPTSMLTSPMFYPHLTLGQPTDAWMPDLSAPPPSTFVNAPHWSVPSAYPPGPMGSEQAFPDQGNVWMGAAGPAGSEWDQLMANLGQFKEPPAV